VRLFDWPPKAAYRDVRDRKYKPLVDRVRFVFALPCITAVGVRCTPTIEQPHLFVIFVAFVVKSSTPFVSVSSFLL
jgi:hypothetical protein